MDKIKWSSETRKISELNPAPYNPRQLTKKQAEDLTKSLNKFSLAEPIVVNLNNTIVGGHQRINILKSQGLEEVDVRVPHRELTLDEEQELNLRLNRNLGEWDFDALANFDIDFLKDVGFEGVELDKIFDITPAEEENEVPAPPQIARAEVGAVYTLGRHRLMCGDSTIRENVEFLMDGQKSEMIHTDPPYNVDYGANKKRPSWNIREIKNDKQTPDQWEKFCKDLYLIFKEFNEGDIYMWGASEPEGMRMRLWLVEFGCHWSATIIWKKQQLVLSPAKYQRMYEPCFYGWFEKSSFGEDRTQTEVWEVDRPRISKLHPTMKPIELCEKAILNSSNQEGIILDLFGGSGSTLIACENTNRSCRIIEIDPLYCDVIIQRYANHTKSNIEEIYGKSIRKNSDS